MAGYVHLVILIFFNVLFENVIGEGDSRYVAFVIDDTFSMANEIDQLKSQTHQLFHAILTSNVARYYDKFALVTFNDPSPGEVRIITDDQNAFKSSLDSIDVHGGDDCPELAMHGILNALNICPSNSVIYVFTDAAAKDYYKFEEIKSLSLKKSIQITFLLTGICDEKGLTRENYIMVLQVTFLLTGFCGDLKDSTNENYLVYHKIAEATSGQVFHLSKSNISKVTKYISQSIASERHLIGQQISECPLDVTDKVTLNTAVHAWTTMVDQGHFFSDIFSIKLAKNLPFQFKVDDKTGNVLIAASKFLKDVPEIDKKMSLKVFDAENNEVESYSILDVQYTNILHIRNPKSGYYKAKLDCQDHQVTHLTIAGSTSGQTV